MPSEGNPPCLLCRSQETKLLRKGIRENPETPVWKCPRCLIQFISPPFTDIREYYHSTYRLTHDSNLGEHMTPEERFLAMRPSMSEPADRFSKLVPKGTSVLDIGCSSGYFMDALQTKGYDVYGVEWNPEDAKFVREVGGLPCEEGTLDEIYPGKTFGAITLLQVLEHQPDPIEFIRQCKRKLIGGGYMYIEVPSSQEALLTIYSIPEYINRFYRESHITYWQAETMASFVGAMGFEASITTRQRYGLLDHINWCYRNEPTPKYRDATDYLNLVDAKHPCHAILSRTTGKVDREYRLQLETLKAGDTVVATCQTRKI